MLTLTENASSIVKTITERSGAAPGAGLRFSREGVDQSSLAVAAVEAPQPGDQVVESLGARVFLEEGAAVVLDNQTLDAEVDEAGSVQFSIAPQL
ncbi:MAG TPA: hypothetical protein VHC41_09865 [Mycobacteriales bacterium]|nr:hypothetical protein [Mycobacteriales bacterium]